MKIFSITKCRSQRLILVALLSINAIFVKGSEFLIMNRVISYTNGNAFSHLITDYTRYPANWLTPNDYYHGTFHAYFKVLSVATDVPFGMQIGVFQYFPSRDNWDGHNFNEVCTEAITLQGLGDEAYYSGTPASWWKEGGREVDFAKVFDFQSLGPVLWGSSPAAPLISTSGGGNDATWAQRTNWMPCTIQVIIVAVSNGSAFSGWDKYIMDPSLRKPTPAYGIDYFNETTDIIVPSTDEYSKYPSMHGALSGSGQKVPLTSGQVMYFRTKAGDGLLASEIQALRIPVRPATPLFVVDKLNHRTSAAISNEYEYSENADMSDAVTCSGNYIDIPAGTTRYFRRIATVNSFKSKAQQLNDESILPISHELLVFDDTIDFPNNTDTNGFYYFYYNADMPVNWKSPENYHYGEVFMRYEIISQKTSTPVGLQFGIWQMIPPETGELHETMSEIAGMNGPGSVVETSSSIYQWWRLDEYLDFTRMDMTWHFGINPWKIDPSNIQIRQENAAVWAQRNTYWFPMKVKVTIVAVEAYRTFSGWDNYVNTNPGGRKPVPDIGIDFVGGTTDVVIPATIEYSYSANMSFATNGTGQKLSVAPGDEIYFRTRAGDGLYASDIQHLVVPDRPSGPIVDIDYLYERTVQQITPDIEYAVSDSFLNPSGGSGIRLSVVPGQDIYFRYKAKSSAFASEIYHLASPLRPASPTVTIDYINEKTHEVFDSTVQYGTAATYTGAITCHNSKVDLNPGTNLYFWENHSDHSFASLAYYLEVPARPSTPTVILNFQTEITSAIASTLEWSVNAGMTQSASGQENSITVNPGTDLYFRQKVTSASFSSGVQHLIVPARPSIPDITIDFSNELTSSVSAALEYSENAVMSGAIQGSGDKVAVTPGTDLYFRQKATFNSFCSGIQHLDIPGRPQVPEINVDYANERTSFISSSIEWSANESLVPSNPGQENSINLTPGNDLYFRIKSTNSSFKSVILHLIVPLRPSAPAYTIDYQTERTHEPVASADEYALIHTMEDAIAGTNTRISLNPGTDLYFKRKATSSSFGSEIQHLIIPDRPSIPVLTINYVNCSTNEPVDQEIIYSPHANLSGATQGNDDLLGLEPGVDLFFARSAGISDFRSEVFHLVVPPGNFLGYSGNDTITLEKTVLYAILTDQNAVLTADDIRVTNGTANNLRSGNVFDVYPASSGIVTVLIPANSVTENSFASNMVSFYYDGTSTGLDEINSAKMTIYPNPSKEGIVFVTGDLITPYNLKVISSNGNLVGELRITDRPTQQLNLQNLPPGIYILKAISGDKSYVKKLVLN